MNLKALLLALMLLFAFTGTVQAGQLDNLPSTTKTDLKNKISQFEARIKPSAVWVFWTLAVIETVIVFGFMFLRGEFELGGVFAQVIRLMLIFGLFYWFFQNTSVMQSIFDGFDALANKANAGASTNLDSIIEKMGDMWKKVGDAVSDNGITGLGDSIALVFIAGLATIAIVLLMAKALTIYMFFLFSLYVGVLFFAFSSLSYTRPWAINGITNIIRSGAKYMIVKLIIGISFATVSTAIANATNDQGTLMYVFVITFLIWSFMNGIDGWVDSYFTGMGGGENNSGVQLAQTMGRGAGIGAVGSAQTGYSAVKEAAAAGGGGGSRGGKAATMAKALGAGAISAGAGALTGSVKAGMGFSTHNAGEKTAKGVMTAGKAVAGSVNAVSAMSGKAAEAVTGNNPISTKESSNASTGGGVSTKDRTGFDTSLLNENKSSSSMTGEIKSSNTKD